MKNKEYDETHISRSESTRAGAERAPGGDLVVWGTGAPAGGALGGGGERAMGSASGKILLRINTEILTQTKTETWKDQKNQYLKT